MATRINRVAGRHGGFLSDSAGLQPHQLDLVYASTTAFLAAKSASGNNSSSAEEGDWFYDSTDNVIKVYDGTNWNSGVINSPLARGNIWRGDSGGLAQAYDANDSGKILVGNGTDLVSVAVSGDATLASTGALTVADVTVGSDATGDVQYKSSATALARLAIGTRGDTLTVNAAGTLPVWSNGKVVYENFNALGTPSGATDQPLTIHQSDFTAFDGSTGVLNLLYTENLRLHMIPLGAGQTLTPVVVAAGLDVGADQADNEGYELSSHWGQASGQRPFVVGEDPAFYFTCKFEIATINGCDVLAVGFRRAPFSPPTSQEDIINADLNDYLDMAALGLTTAATPGAIKIQTIDDNAATTVTDTTNTIASATALTVKVLVSAAGVVTYQHDAVTPGTLAAPTTTAAFTLDTGDPVVPFFHYLHANAAQAGAITIHSWEAGYQ